MKTTSSCSAGALLRASLTLLPALLVASCSESGDRMTTESRAGIAAAPVEACDRLLGAPGSRVELDATLCPGCRIENPESAADGDYDSVATIHFGQLPLGVTGAVKLRASAAAGTRYEPGFAGVLLGQPIWQSGNFVQGAIPISVQTFLGGKAQETYAVFDRGPYLNAKVFEQFRLRGFMASKPFDSVELTYSWLGAAEPGLVRVSEFCGASRIFAGAYVQDPDRHPKPATAAAPGADGRYEVDLLLLYTPRYLKSLGSRAAVIAEAQRLVDHANKLFVDSGIPGRYRVLAVEPYGGASETTLSYVMINVLRQDAEVKQLRDHLGADITALLTVRDLGVDQCGIAGLFNGGKPSDSADSVDSDQDSFAVVHTGDGQFSKRCNATVLAHELGHIVGGGHEAESASPGSYWKPYAHAWTCGTRPDGSPHVTVMHSDGTAIADAAVFSSPLLSHGGEACGQTQDGGEEAQQADNVRSISEALPYVAGYRQR